MGEPQWKSKIWEASFIQAVLMMLWSKFSDNRTKIVREDAKKNFKWWKIQNGGQSTSLYPLNQAWWKVYCKHISKFAPVGRGKALKGQNCFVCIFENVLCHCARFPKKRTKLSRHYHKLLCQNISIWRSHTFVIGYLCAFCAWLLIIYVHNTIMNAIWMHIHYK